jgi:DNA-binding IclR family transcriptional regulator
MWRRIVALWFLALFNAPKGWQLAAKWDGEIRAARNRRITMLDQLEHEVNKVRQGGYWRESGWEFRLGFRSVVPTKLRWTPR